MDAFQLGHICNHSDSAGRYAWARQPSVGLWNLYRLAASLHTLFVDQDPLRVVLNSYESTFTVAFHRRMAKKLGINDWVAQDSVLLDDLLQLMHDNQADFTLAFRALAQAVRGLPQSFEDLFIDRLAAGQWLQRLLARHEQDNVDAQQRAMAMDRVNPLYILRNHLAELAIAAAKQGDASELEVLLRLLRNPYVEQAGFERYASLPPDWATDIAVSCSS